MKKARSNGHRKLAEASPERGEKRGEEEGEREVGGGGGRGREKFAFSFPQRPRKLWGPEA